MSKHKNQEPVQKLGVYVDTSLPNYCSWCGKPITQVEISTNDHSSIKTEMAVCKNCKKAFTTVSFFVKQKNGLYSLNPEDTDRLIRQKKAEDKAEKARNEAAWNAKQEEAKNAKKLALKEATKLKKLELLDKINQQLVNVSPIDLDAIRIEWLNMKIDLNTINSIMAIYIVKDYTGNSNCILVSMRDEVSKRRVIAGNRITLISWRDVRGRILLSSGKFNFNYYYYIDKRYDIVNELIIYPASYRKRLKRIGNNYADRWRENENNTLLSSSNSQDIKTRVYVYFSLANACIKNRHAIENVTAKTTNVKNNQPIEVNVFYCELCKKYFINYEALQKYISRGIYPALHYSFNRLDDGMLKDASELMLYGYNVREGNLTMYERRRILEWIIDCGLMTKAEIIRDLQFKVRYNGSKPGNERARQKWQDDIQFVSQYTRGNSRTINATFIFKNK